ncbi:MAG: xylulokinase [Planctomycetaceae bacterium]|nr:xylulokinase [Planctomycetaceae bacterium]
MFMGIDCGTQGTKVLLFDDQNGRVAGIGHAPHEIIATDAGRREQHPSWWVTAMIAAARAAMAQAGCAPEDVKAIGISGQHHGLVMLDENGAVLREAKLWNDMETAEANRDVIREAGGDDAVAKRLGTALPVGYTASKVRWMLRNEPELWAKTRHIMCPHDYLNYWLTGRMVMEPGDASGTGFFDVAGLKWDVDMANLIDPTGVLAKALPEIIRSDDCVGALTREAAAQMGLTTATLVAGGSGDNVMGAFGTGNVSPGGATLGLGTSGVLNIHTDKPATDLDPVLQVFAGASGGWLLTSCIVNATSATTSVQHLLEMELAPFAAAMGEAPAGAEGLRLFPYFNGERTPPLPEARGTLRGMTTTNLTRPNLIRAAAEAVVFGLKWGLDRQMPFLTERPAMLRLTGGGTGNPVWRQIIADVFDAPTVGLVHDEGGAFGGALLAMLMLERRNGGSATAADLCDRFVLFDDRKRTEPTRDGVEFYREYYGRYDQERKLLYGI